MKPGLNPAPIITEEPTKAPDFYKGVEVYYASVEALKQTRQNSALFRETFGIT